MEGLGGGAQLPFLGRKEGGREEKNARGKRREDDRHPGISL